MYLKKKTKNQAKKPQNHKTNSNNKTNNNNKPQPKTKTTTIKIIKNQT